MKTYQLLKKSVQTISAFRKQSELETNELQIEIVRQTDWRLIADAIENMEATLRNIAKLKSA